MFIDSHCHFDFPAFDADRDACWQRARGLGLGHLIIPAVNKVRWPRVMEIAQKYPDVHFALGLHPLYLADHQPEHIEDLRAHLQERQHVVAIGEIGLDGTLPLSRFEEQWAYFTAQLDIALERDLPVIIHARKSVDQVIKAIRQRPGLRGVVHSFSGSLQQAEQLMNQGFMLGFGGAVTWDRAKRLQAVLQALPANVLLLETDAPDQPGAGHARERNEPAWLAEILQQIAAIRGESHEALANATTANALHLFKPDASGLGD
ncbi:TatD DNase family protein [Ectothiorhodosinus mongolicus]|uniref:TatD DNase family protein n=1 Tax=Ectothiorhodosinus mongolicus TaxID=233100 RepID=A0A1R3VXM1_9GAMM|nr:TatD family hydrolase [Ectothiorhodosinus mongolicus]ULX57095.1 TatD family deoxyribonuclease [Ectothiorhodosinus mongolicus]SIT69894.1 TatD DNase family protein [Ectothiorhodosinus mongolicus]